MVFALALKLQHQSLGSFCAPPSTSSSAGCTLDILSKRYPGTLDETKMDRYLGMGFSYNEDTGAMTCSMYHAVVKILASCRTDSLPVQPTPYTMDIFDPSTNLAPVDSKSYQSVTGGLGVD